MCARNQPEIAHVVQSISKQAFIRLTRGRIAKKLSTKTAAPGQFSLSARTPRGRKTKKTLNFFVKMVVLKRRCFAVAGRRKDGRRDRIEGIVICLDGLGWLREFVLDICKCSTLACNAREDRREVLVRNNVF